LQTDVASKGRLIEQLKGENTSLSTQLRAVESKMQDLSEALDPEGSISVDELFSTSSRHSNLDGSDSRGEREGEADLSGYGMTQSLNSPSFAQSFSEHKGGEKGGGGERGARGESAPIGGVGKGRGFPRAVVSLPTGGIDRRY
jgi:hypothetical protein